MNTEFGEKLQQAMNSMNSIDNLVWKDKNGNSIKLMKASVDDLSKWYNHCYEMLYNEDSHYPGKFVIRENIHKAWDSCNVELFVRHLLYECDTPIKTKKDILDLINNQRDQYNEDISDKNISYLFNGLDPIYENITIGNLVDACLDRLDILNRKMISDKFILSLGIWLTDEEKVDLTETLPDGSIRDRRDVIKERLSLNKDIPIKIIPTGLTYNEFRSVVKLGFLPKISSLSTNTLKTLRDKILLLLDNDLNYHINKWTNLMNNIQRVADARNISLQINATN